MAKENLTIEDLQGKSFTVLAATTQRVVLESHEREEFVVLYGSGDEGIEASFLKEVKTKS